MRKQPPQKDITLPMLGRMNLSARLQTFVTRCCWHPCMYARRASRRVVSFEIVGRKIRGTLFLDNSIAFRKRLTINMIERIFDYSIKIIEQNFVLGYFFLKKSSLFFVFSNNTRAVRMKYNLEKVIVLSIQEYFVCARAYNMKILQY